jgi:cytochrome c553
MRHGAARLLGAAAALACAAVQAQATPEATRGAQLVASCASCHGHGGEGLAAGGFPRLAGQPAAYLAKQLQDYAAGSRRHAVMESFARQLAAQDIADIAAYYAGLKTPPARHEGRSGWPPQGRQLANLGDARLGVQACDNCHGPSGRGEPPLLPYLAGQNASYLEAQLQAWQSGSRNNDASGQMAALAKKLGTAEIGAVTQYFAQQQPPGQ